MFEYMLAGIPVIASNYPYWESILSENKCGVSTNPLSPKDIADSILKVLKSDDIVIMGKNGQKAISDKYNWNIEEEKLLKMYKNILYD